MLRRREKNNTQKTTQEKSISTLIEKDNRSIFTDGDVRQLVAPDGVNPNPLGYMTINDKGRDIYVRMFYIDKMPKRTTFATTFASVFNFEDVTASVFIDPLTEGRAIAQLDKQVLSLGTEQDEAEKSGNPNRIRKMTAKLAKTEAWAANIESGENQMYEVAFLFTLYAKSLEELGLKTGDFVSKAREKGISMVACYSAHPEAYLCNGPFNRIYPIAAGPVGMVPIKKHLMDKYGLSTIFSHTRPSFSHESGIPAGHTMKNWETVLWDPYSPSHNGFGVLYCGKTGTGKSATIKMYVSRLEPFSYRFAIIDSDKKGSRGEYCPLTEAEGGVVFEVKSGNGRGGDFRNTLNPYEIDVQEEFNEDTGMEYTVLRVLDKVTDVTNTYLTMIKNGKAQPDFNLATYMESIINDANTYLYEEKGIRENEPDSLYERNASDKDVLLGSKRKKELPTISDFYIRILKMQRYDTNPFHAEAYTLIVDSIKDRVRELYYNSETLERVTKEEYEAALRGTPGLSLKYVKVVGAKSYYDGQSTVFFNRNTPIVNIDISDLPKNEIPVAQPIALNFLNEHFIKKNSENPTKAGKMVIIIDEAHRMFVNEDSRKFIADVYRTARKRHVSPWTCTQAFKDFSGYDETESIVTNTTSKFIFKQDPLHRQFLADNTVLTMSQVDAVLSLGGDPNDPENVEHRGEVCLIDNDTVVFLKVDYLKETEKEIVETDMSKLAKASA